VRPRTGSPARRLRRAPVGLDGGRARARHRATRSRSRSRPRPRAPMPRRIAGARSPSTPAAASKRPGRMAPAVGSARRRWVADADPGDEAPGSARVWFAGPTDCSPASASPSRCAPMRRRPSRRCAATAWRWPCCRATTVRAWCARWPSASRSIGPKARRRRPTSSRSSRRCSTRSPRRHGRRRPQRRAGHGGRGRSRSRSARAPR
jgi:hypothetical protein